MRLREFIMILGSAAVWPRVAVEPSAALLAAFKQRFQETQLDRWAKRPV
jgi:hypothetical protein